MFQPSKEWWAGQFHIPENWEYKESFYRCQLIFSLKFPSCVKTWINVCNGVKSSFFTLFVRFILGFPFLLNRFLGVQMHWLFKCHGSHKPGTNNLFHSGSLSMSPSCDNNTFSFLVTVPAEERRASQFYFSDNQESKESLIKVFLVSRKFCDWFIHKPAVKTTN